MHFRLGDYKAIQHYHPIMNDKYYIDALTAILDKNQEYNILYFCESEDNEEIMKRIEIINSNFNNLKFIKISDDIPDWEQIIIMSLCNHNIIANSSFSWWGAYFNSHENKIVCYPKSLDIIYEQDWKEKRELAWPTDGALGGFCRESGEYQDLGKTNLNIKGHWSPNFKLNVAVEVPELPRGFVELGDEAVALYYAHVKGTSKELRKKTSLRSPSLGVLWIPNPKAFYATGNIPKIEPPPKKGDPVLVLDIPGEKRSYRHAVAAWNIGEEIHFRNWLAEYTEGGRV